MSQVNQVGDVIQSQEHLGPLIYVVVETEMTGGTHTTRDYYPDGHQITLLPLRDGEVDNSAKRRKFFQSGCFNGRIPYIKPIVKVKIAQQYIVVR